MEEDFEVVCYFGEVLGYFVIGGVGKVGGRYLVVVFFVGEVGVVGL